MIEVTSNINVIIQAKLEQILELKKNPDPILRTVALTVLPALRKRVHVDGLDASGSKIGTYSAGYMVVRTGSYKNAETYKKGAKAGQRKNSGKFTDQTIKLNKQTGVFTGEDKSGKARPNYNRTADTTVILSLTRQMENDESVVPTPSGYGIGFLNPFNFKKAIWCEETYGKKILTKLTTGELDLAQKTAQEFTNDYLKTI
jgi:hypothetical protein